MQRVSFLMRRRNALMDFLRLLMELFGPLAKSPGGSRQAGRLGISRKTPGPHTLPAF